jgi:hypothetical protein
VTESREGSVRALPLWQPWASLVVLGEKRIETRHWAAPASILGKRIAIHATKTQRELWVCDEPEFADALGRHGLDEGDLPLGALIGLVTVKRCAPMTAEGIARLRVEQPNEWAFGHYVLGRFAWVLADPEPLPEPVPWKGSQGIFSVPASAVGVDVAPPAQRPQLEIGEAA